VIVAALNRGDRHHEAIIELLGPRRQGAVLDWIDDPEVSIFSIDDGITFMRRQMADYADLPCDFADATLIYAAWRTRIREIWTLDLDFLVYRLPDRTRFKVIPDARRRQRRSRTA
jgi:hypothetical protein